MEMAIKLMISNDIKAINFNIYANKELENCNNSLHSQHWNSVIQSAYYHLIYTLIQYLINNGKNYGNKIIHETVISFFIQEYCYLNKQFNFLRFKIQDLQNLKALIDKKVNLNENEAKRAVNTAQFINNTLNNY